MSKLERLLEVAASAYREYRPWWTLRRLTTPRWASAGITPGQTRSEHVSTANLY